MGRNGFFKGDRRLSPSSWCNSEEAEQSDGHRVILASLELRTDDTEDHHDGRRQYGPARDAPQDVCGRDVDVLREGVRMLAQAIMEGEVSEVTGLVIFPGRFEAGSERGGCC